MRWLHCSDIHLLALKGARIRQFLNKRVTGAMNLMLGRGRAHEEARFDAMMQLAVAEQVEHVLISGDLTNLGLRSEFEHVASVLKRQPMRYWVVPGNHDVYVDGEDAGELFRAIFASQHGEPVQGTIDYPYRVIWEDVALFGLNSAIARPAFRADGALGEKQLACLERALQSPDVQNKMRVVMLHHPVTEAANRPRRDLVDRAALRAVLRRAGAELVVHGHEHREIGDFIEGPGSSRIAVHGVASGTATSGHTGRRAACTIYEFVDSLKFCRYLFDSNLGRWLPHEAGFQPLAAHASEVLER